MNKEKNYIIAGVFLLGLVLLSIWWVSRNQGSESSSAENDNAGIVYFYGETCSHCQDVAKFISDNKIDKKVSFVKREVWNNKKNADAMMEKAKECGINPNEAGVPFVYAEGKCYIGTPDVIGFFKNKAGM